LYPDGHALQFQDKVSKKLLASQGDRGEVAVVALNDKGKMVKVRITIRNFHFLRSFISLYFMNL